MDKADRIYLGAGRDEKSGDVVVLVKIASSMDEAAEAMQSEDGFVLELMHPRYFDINSGARFRLHGMKSRNIASSPQH